MKRFLWLLLSYILTQVSLLPDIGGLGASVLEVLCDAHPSSYSGYSPKKFWGKLNLIWMQWNKVPLSGNNIMLFNKGGEGLNRKKIRGHAFHMQFLLYYHSTVVLKGLHSLLTWGAQMSYKRVCKKTIFAISSSTPTDHWLDCLILYSIEIK